MKDYRIPLTREQNLMIRVLKKKRPVLVSDVKAAGLNPANRILADFGPSSFIVCPLIAEEDVIGILAADRKTRPEAPYLGGHGVLSIFANNIATVFHRASLDEQLKTSYVSSVMALVQAIEEKDKYTAGHSERVAKIVVRVARELGISEHEMEYLRFGSILHDVGKIGIPESIVEEPQAADRIPSTRSSRSIPSRAWKSSSTSRSSGTTCTSSATTTRGGTATGYPDGLRGDEIPLGAQIVAVADAFDAMTSSRPYRKGLPPKQAAREIRKGIGTQFSAAVVNAFLYVFEKDPSSKMHGRSPKIQLTKKRLASPFFL